MNTPHYVLYYRPNCPFCRKVLQFAEEHGIALDLRDIDEEVYEQELMAKGGKRQVPYLVDGDTAMYESDDIIAHLESQQ